MTKEKLVDGQLATRRSYTPAFKAECVRQLAAGDVARARSISPTLLGRWRRQALAQAVPSNAEREEIKRLRAELHTRLGSEWATGLVNYAAIS